MSSAADPTFPALHIRPPHGWLNDPNGVCRIDGTYHVFFQFNPAGPIHANVHWGHVSSPDLLRWTEEPVALTPQPGSADQAGCWSGCIVDDDGVPTALYTGVQRHAWESGVMLARSDRTLREWTQERSWQVGIPEHPEITEVRDPYVFTFEGHRYAVQGAGRREGPPRLLLYGVDDLADWQELGDLLTLDDPVAAEIAPAQIWECPNLFPLGDRWVLLVSLWRFIDGTYALTGVRYLVGDLEPTDEGGLRFRATSGGELDAGPSFYAPQVLLDGDRALLWAWAWERPGREAEVAASGWAGVLTFPRELTLEGDRVVSRPARELAELRDGPLDWSGPLVDPSFEILAQGPLELRLVGVDDPDDDDGELVLAHDGPVQVLVDGSMVEVFGDDGSATVRAYPSATRHWRVVADPDRTTVQRLSL